jgi:hypothetical protein
MSNLQIRLVDPMSSSYARRITEEEWDRHADAVKTMHEDRKPRREMLVELEKTFGFCPSMPQLNTHMKKRKLYVYNKASEGIETGKDEVVDQAGHGVDLADQKVLPRESQLMETVEGMIKTDELQGTALPTARAAGQESAENMPNLLPLSLEPATLDEYGMHGSHRVCEVLEEGQKLLNPITTSWEAMFVLSIDPEDENLAEIEDRGRILGMKNLSDNQEVTVPPIAMDRHDQQSLIHAYPDRRTRESSVDSLRSYQSEASSLREFRECAADISWMLQLRRQERQSSPASLSVMSEESWNFGRVTGMPDERTSRFGGRELKAAKREAAKRITAEREAAKRITAEREAAKWITAEWEAAEWEALERDAVKWVAKWVAKLESNRSSIRELSLRRTFALLVLVKHTALVYGLMAT